MQNRRNGKADRKAIGAGKRNTVKGGPILETRSFQEQGGPERQELKLLGEGVGERAMDEYDSGGRSADKGPAAEDEGSTTPLPEKV